MISKHKILIATTTIIVTQNKSEVIQILNLVTRMVMVVPIIVIKITSYCFCNWHLIVEGKTCGQDDDDDDDDDDGMEDDDGNDEWGW